MALDSKNKRGSAISLTMPNRQWLAEPDGALDSRDRAALAKLCAAIAPASPGGVVGGTVFESPVFVSRVIRGARP